jgi:hypothetical protein
MGEQTMDPEVTKALYGAVGAFAGAVGGALIAGVTLLRTSRKTLFVNTITKERAEWRSDLRKAVGDLVVRVHEALDDPNKSLLEVHESRVAILLRLNPNDGPDHVLDRLILEALEHIPKLLRPAKGPLDRGVVLGQLARVECCAQRLLKKEWTKSKDEARTGEMHK